QLRLGYSFEPSPIKPIVNQLATFVDNDRHIFGLGAGWGASPWRIDGFVQVQLLNRDVRSGGTIFVTGLAVGVGVQWGAPRSCSCSSPPAAPPPPPSTRSASARAPPPWPTPPLLPPSTSPPTITTRPASPSRSSSPSTSAIKSLRRT